METLLLLLFLSSNNNNKNLQVEPVGKVCCCIVLIIYTSVSVHILFSSCSLSTIVLGLEDKTFATVLKQVLQQFSIELDKKEHLKLNHLTMKYAVFYCQV